MYGLSTQFVLRMTGFPVEALQALNRPELVVAAQRYTAAQTRALKTQRALREALLARGPTTRKLRKEVERGHEIARGEEATLHALIDAYNVAQVETAEATPRFAEQFAREHEAARAALYAAIQDPRYRAVLLYSTPALERLVPPPDAGVPTRNTDWRRREVTWLSYLQRLATKNETISFYGPSVWGRIDAGLDEVADIALADGDVDARTMYVERWPTAALLEQIGSDPEAFVHLRPLWVADLLPTSEGAELLASGTRLTLARSERELLASCDGTRTVGELGDADGVRRLVEQGAVRPTASLTNRDRPFERLVELVAGWPEGPARARWGERLQRLEDRRAELASASAAHDLTRQRAGIAAVQAEVADLPARGNALYAARLPINEDCRRAAERVRLGAPFIERATIDLAPYYELWRDLAGLYATRIFETLRRVWASAGGARMRLPVFLRACTDARLPFARSGGAGMAPELYAEIQRAWAEQLGARASEPEVTLTTADLAFVRDRFRFRRMRGLDRPAPDIQIAARDEAALHASEFTMVLAEIHGDAMLWQHALQLWCPDVGRLREEFALGPAFDFVGDALGNVHTQNLLSHLCGQPVLLSDDPAAGESRVRAADVWVELTDDDLVARHQDGRLLGSLIDTREVVHCTHQLQLLGAGPHSPRLRCGRVVVQRRRWRLTHGLSDELAGAPAEIYAAAQALRVEQGWPYEVFVNPELPVRNTLHKAGKPFFVDFRNPLLVELLIQQLRDYRAVLVTEMLPSTEDCWLSDARGHYSCELRMVAQPARDRDALVAGGFAVAPSRVA